MGLYGIGFISFIALEFSVYESMLSAIEKTTQGQTSLIQFIKDPEHKAEHHGLQTSDVLLAGTLAGAIASFATNCIEVLAVNKQTNSAFKVRHFLQQKGNMRLMFF